MKKKRLLCQIGIVYLIVIVTLAGCGGGKSSTLKTGTDWYCYMVGTSMAAPHVSGIVALMLANGISSSQILDRLRNGCIPVDSYSGRTNDSGYGIPDAYAILNNTTPVNSKTRVLIRDSGGDISYTALYNVGGGGYFCIKNLPAGSYVAMAFIDTNSSGALDSGEQYCSSSTFSIRTKTFTTGITLSGWSTYSGDSNDFTSSVMPSISNGTGSTVCGFVADPTVSGSSAITMFQKAFKIKSSSSRSFAKFNIKKATNFKKTVANEKIIRFRDGMSQTEIQNILSKYGGSIKRKIFGTNNTYVIQIDTSGQVVNKMVSEQKNAIIHSEDNLYVHALGTTTPNDEYYPDQIWNTYTLNLPNAWGIRTDCSAITVAVLDSGVSTTHPDLAAHLDLNNAYNFVDNNKNPLDQDGHGTHVAGIIGAITNNGTGIAGVAWNVKIMPVRVLGSDGQGNVADVASGINWAVSHGAKVINLSLGKELSKSDAVSNTSLATFRDALDNAFKNNVIVVAAAGNEGHYVDFPANYSSSYGKVIAVAALGSNLRKASYSNFGLEIDVTAPGGEAVSVDYGETYYSYQMILSTYYDLSQ